MAMTGVALKEFCLVLDRKDLREMYPRLDSEQDWHRVSQRLYVLNRKFARPAGVELALHREKEAIRAYFSSPEQIHKLIRALRRGRGFVQKTMAGCIQGKASLVVDRRSIPRKLMDSQIGLLREALSKDLGLFAGIDLDSVLVDVPLAPEAPEVTVFSRVAALLPAGIFVLGESGSGKTTLLYAILRRWATLGSKLSGYTPVYVSARHLHFAWGQFEMPWGTLPGAEPHMADRLEAAFTEGRLVLLIDGINENPACTDFANPAVQSFWKAAARNPCVITLLPRFYDSHVKISPLESFFRTSRITLPQWDASLYKKLFERILAASKKNSPLRLGALASYLDRLSAREWQKTSSLLRFTPLTGLACANFFASHHGERLPKDEYELMEHMTAFHLRHEGFKGSSLLVLETAMGLLMRLAWQAYLEGQGGKFSCVSTDNAARVIREYYPLLDDRRPEVFTFLTQLPYLEYSAENGLFYMNQHFADFLVARYLIQAFLSGDFRRLKEALNAPWQYLYVTRYYFQGLQGLARHEKLQFFHVSQNLFNSSWQEFLKTKDFGSEIAIAHLIQPLGFLDLPEAADFLWKVFNDSKGKAEFVTMSAAVGLGWGGDPKGVEAYVEWMRRTSKSSEFNLRWYLFYRRHDRSRKDIENFEPKMIESWDRVCDWLLEAMLKKDRDFRPLWLLYAYSFCNFLKVMGMGPFTPHEEGNGSSAGPARDRRELLSRVLAAWDRDLDVAAQPALLRQFKELVALAKKHGIQRKGGANHGVQKSQTRKEKDLSLAKALR